MTRPVGEAVSRGRVLHAGHCLLQWPHCRAWPGPSATLVYSRQNMAHRQGRKLRSSPASTKARGGGEEVLQARHPCSLWRKHAGAGRYLLKDLGRTHAGAGEKCEEEKSVESSYQGLTTCPLSRSL